MSAIRQIVEQGLYKDTLSVLMWVLSFKTPEQKRDHLKALRHDFLTSEYELPPAGDDHVLFMRSLGREDYASMFGVIFNSCIGVQKTYLSSFKKTKVSHNAKAATYFEENLDLEDWIEVRDPLDRQCAFVLLLSYGYLLEFYADVKFRAVVTFSDMQPIENFFAGYFRSKGIPTATLQHGLYIDYGEYKTINCINYMSHVSDYFLAWGENTARLISAYHPDAKIVICGKPVIFQGSPSPRKGAGQSIMIALDQIIFNNENHAMAGIVADYATKHGYEVTVRFHPSLDKSAFFKVFPDIVESVSLLDADVVVGHTTSLLFEALALRKRVVQYKTDIPTIDLPAALQFKDLAGLEKAAAVRIEAETAKSYFGAVANDSKQRYEDFFRYLLDGDNSAKVEFYRGQRGKKQPHSWFDTMKRDFFEATQTAAQQVPSATPDAVSVEAFPTFQGTPSLARVHAIVVPCLASDLPILNFIFQMWGTPQFAPSLTGRKVRLLLVFNRLDPETRRSVLEMWHANPTLSHYFDELQVESADLIGDRDLYVKNRNRDVKGAFGNIAGPNFLFQSSMNYAARFGGYVFQMEVDCFPLTQGWLEELDRVIGRAGGAWVIGTMYNGNFRINNPVRMHLNGNALYKTGDPKFIAFLNSIWIPRLLDLAKELPNLAYDSWWALEIERSKTDDLSPDSSWNLVRCYNSFFYNDPFIINLLKSDPLEERFGESYRFYESTGKPPVFLHYAHCKALAERVLAGEAESLRDLLLPSPKISDDPLHLEACDIKMADGARISFADTPALRRDGDLLTQLEAMLSPQNPSPSRCRLFLTVCISELLMRPVEYGKRIAEGGDLEEALVLALKHNTDMQLAERMARIRNHKAS